MYFINYILQDLIREEFLSIIASRAFLRFLNQLINTRA